VATKSIIIFQKVNQRQLQNQIRRTRVASR
jgi:hypothetical protein